MVIQKISNPLKRKIEVLIIVVFMERIIITAKALAKRFLPTELRDMAVTHAKDGKYFGGSKSQLLPPAGRFYVIAFLVDITA